MLLPDGEETFEKVNRKIKVEYPIRELEDGYEVAVFSCSHQRETNYFSGESGKRFNAVLHRETVKKDSRTFRLFSGLRVCTEPVDRYSEKRLREFAERAKRELEDLAGADHPGVVKMFDPSARERRVTA